MFWGMAKKSRQFDSGIAAFALALAVAAAGLCLFIFNVGKDVGKYQERIAQLERRAEQSVETAISTSPSSSAIPAN